MIVSSICPSCKTTCTPRAKPTTKAATTISSIPLTKAFVATFKDIREIAIALNPINKNPPAISFIHQPNSCTAKIINANNPAPTSKIIKCSFLKSTFSNECSSREKSSSGITDFEGSFLILAP